MSWSVVHGEIKPGKVEGPSSLATVKLLRCHEVLQVLVVRPDFKLVMSAFQEMAPVFQSSDDCYTVVVTNDVKIACELCYIYLSVLISCEIQDTS
jgi:hypothetical protein